MYSHQVTRRVELSVAGTRSIACADPNDVSLGGGGGGGPLVHCAAPGAHSNVWSRSEFLEPRSAITCTRAREGARAGCTTPRTSGTRERSAAQGRKADVSSGTSPIRPLAQQIEMGPMHSVFTKSKEMRFLERTSRRASPRI